MFTHWSFDNKLLRQAIVEGCAKRVLRHHGEDAWCCRIQRPVQGAESPNMFPANDDWITFVVCSPASMHIEQHLQKLSYPSWSSAYPSRRRYSKKSVLNKAVTKLFQLSFTAKSSVWVSWLSFTLTVDMEQYGFNFWLISPKVFHVSMFTGGTIVGSFCNKSHT